MSKGEGHSPNRKGKAMTEVQDIAFNYPTILNAKQTYERVAPVLEQMLKFRDAGISFTPAMVGEALMGADYHATKEQYFYNGVRKLRLPEAYSLSSTIGHALYILRKTGMVTYEIKKDLDHPNIFEDDTLGYFLNGAQIPDTVRVRINGDWVSMDARNIEGVERKWIKKQVTRYPKIYWYTFK